MITPQVWPVNEDSDLINIALNKYANHPSLLKIKEYFNEPTKFNFSEVIPNDIEKEINKLDISKNGTFKNINPKSMKKRQMYVGRHYALYKQNKLYEKELFWSILKTQM